MARYVDPQFAHHGNRLGTDETRVCPGAKDLIAAACQMTKETLRHLASRGIASTQNQHSRRTHCAVARPASAGFTARTNALMNLPSTAAAAASTSIPDA